MNSASFSGSIFAGAANGLAFSQWIRAYSSGSNSSGAAKRLAFCQCNFNFEPVEKFLVHGVFRVRFF
jgi:hypothetical protein